MFLIEHPEGLVVFETGLHPALAVDPKAHWGARATERKPRMRPEQFIERQLDRIGVAPKDVRSVVLSCLLPDHAGGMQAFPHVHRPVSGAARCMVARSAVHHQL
jgi:N-acyl homoserine lactone hydrolase